MNVQGFQGADTKVDAEARIAHAATLLVEADAGVPSAFVDALFGAAAPEDVAALSPEAISVLAREAYGHFSARAPGQHMVRVFTPTLPDGTAVTVVEAINDDMAFLFDSVAGELADRGYGLTLAAHPILTVERDGAGTLVAIEPEPRKPGKDGRDLARESLIHLHIAPIDEAAALALKAALEETLADVGAANEDFLPMRKQVKGLGKAIRKERRPYGEEDRDEASDLIEWVADDNFLFLGTRQYSLADNGDLIPEEGLGILRDPCVHELRLGEEPVVATPEIRQFLEGPRPLLVTKASLRSRVHRRAFMDYVGIKTHDDKGRLTGEVRVIGLFAASAYTHSVRQIPYVRRKAETVIKRAGLDPESHSGKALATVLETYPRDDLFQIDADTLFDHASAILSLIDRPRVKVLPRLDPFDRFVSVLVYVPRERFDADLREKIGQRLSRAYDGHVSAFAPYFLVEAPMARIHFIIGRRGGRIPAVDQAALEKAVADDVLTWGDRLKEAVAAAHPPREAKDVTLRYGNAFGPGYVAAYGVDTAVADIARLERLSADKPIALDFYRRAEDPENRISLRLISYGMPLPLSLRVPMLENMGLKAINERTYRIEPEGPGAAKSWVHDMTLERADGAAIAMEGSDERLEDCLTAVLRRDAENDGFNALVLDAGLPWRDVALIRALARYLRQAGLPFSLDYLWRTLNTHPALAARIVALFKTRFDPALAVSLEAASAREAREAPLRAAIDQDLAAVSSLDEDRILRRFVNLVDAAARTTFFQKDGEGRPKGPIAIKYESAKVEGLPLPRPLFEVFVYAPRVEGVHLRFGHVARGGLRWSDRPQDFRTEVLGLVKAQQVKNAVIVPVGAKGGFVPKWLPQGGAREEIQLEGIAAYEVFVSSLLDLTDNLVDGKIAPPAGMARLDGDDPYLVVAADKGTATFSDTANAISARHHFWLDDAFASGGSVGYDHKAMGITARGAWEAVKRHFREMDVDIQHEPVTVVGVGDMSGDVFGNGMLLSSAIRLVAAFDHRHVFLDPSPEPHAAHAERQRLFNLPRSSWADYDAALISEGGGVYPRSAKSIPLSPEIREVLGFDKEAATPNEVISAILKAPVELLFFGGIGTYVRASVETDAQAGDRANDAVRVAASDLRVKVIGEGANLGMTQRGRIEAARKGVRLNTDAIDNSAGVNTSDVEVNIKIALAQPLKDGELDRQARAELLGAMTDEVGLLVLRNNYLQTLALSLAQMKGINDLPFQQRLMQRLEATGELDRAVEFLPADHEIADRKSRGEFLTRPELAVLLAYAKLSLHAELLASDVPDDAYLSGELVHYFPKEIQERFPGAIETHRLHREIIATGLSNAIINQGGPAFVARICDETGADAATVARAFAAVRDSFHLPETNAAIDELDNKVSGATQLRLYAHMHDLAIGRTIWFLRNVSFADGIAGVVERYRAGIEKVEEVMDESLPPQWRENRDARIYELVGERVPEELAHRIATLPLLATASDIALVAEKTGRPMAEAASTFFAAGRYFGLDGLITQVRAIQAPDYYDRLALDRAVGQMETFARHVTGAMLASGHAGEKAVEAYVAGRRRNVERTRAAVADIASSGLTLSKLTLAASLLTDLCQE